MTFKILKQIADKPTATSSRIGSKDPDNAGTMHPLWAMLNAKFPPEYPWNRIQGGLRAGILRIAQLMHERNIPYGVYVDWLARFDKGYLKRRPMALVGYKENKDGATPIFKEFLLFIEQQLAVLKDNPEAIKVVDHIYHMYPKAYSIGPFRYLYTLDLINQTLLKKIKTAKTLVVELAKHDNLDDYLHAIGGGKAEVITVDLSEGRRNDDGLRRLTSELKVRLGVMPGFPNPSLNHYFKADGKLNAQGLKVVTGERPLKEEAA